MPSALLHLMGALYSKAWHRNGLSSCRLAAPWAACFGAKLTVSSDSLETILQGALGPLHPLFIICYCANTLAHTL